MLALAQIVIGIALCLTVIGIPFGIACFKVVGLALFPLGKEIVDADHPTPRIRVSMPSRR